MPTINKQGTFESGQAIDAAARMLTELPGFKEISTTLEGADEGAHVISVDGREDVCFFIGRIGSSYLSVGIAKKSSNGYSVFKYKGSDYTGSDIWLRCYTSASSASDRLITVGYSKTPGKADHYAIVLMVGDDVENNTVYGYGETDFSGLYCLETGIFVNIDFWESETNTGSLLVPENLNDKAVLVKAVNFCHPNLVEMKNFYTANWRPRTSESFNMAQRYLISSSLWGFASVDKTDYAPILFDPALKI